MRKLLMIAGVCATALSGCSTGQIASGVAVVDKYQAEVQAACAVAMGVLNAPTTAPLRSVSVIDRAANLIAAGCGTEQAVASLMLSSTSVAWLGTLITTIQSMGTVVPPPPSVP